MKVIEENTMKWDKQIKFVFWRNKLVKPVRNLEKKMKMQNYKYMEWKGTTMHRVIGKIRDD